MSIHLVALVHGMWGNKTHLAELNRIILETHVNPTPDGTELHVLLPETNSDDSTYDGIDWGGERVAEEILASVKSLQKDGKTVAKFSITGYSLGGLISRYVIGILKQKGFFDNVQPINFNTFATPHIGLLRYPSMMSSIFSTLGPKLLSRTGEQFYCVDSWSTNGRPLLEVMADPERIFFQALDSFPHVCIYANAANDSTVPYITAAIELDDPFLEREENGIEVHTDKTYKHVITSFEIPSEPLPKETKPTILTKEWFVYKKSKKHHRRFFLPPPLRFGWPANIIVYPLLPFLIPVFISLVLLRLSMSSRSSRQRIRVLEKEADSSHRLISVISHLERQMESAMIDAMEDSSPENDEVIPKADSKQPIIPPVQRRIAKNLNSLPHLQKVLSWFPEAFNSHAVIISRDVQRFDFHREGEGVIRHWADHFEL